MVPTLALSAFWFTYFCGIGMFFPYYGLYLRENAALTGTQVGLVLATFPLVALVAQPLWGQVADLTGARSRLLALLAAGTTCGLVVLWGSEGFVELLTATALTAAFATPIVPLTASVSFAALRHAGPHAFGFVRVWGTIGFFLSVVAFPLLLERFQVARGLLPRAGGPSEPALHLMFAAIALCTAAAAIIAVFLPAGGAIGLRAAPGAWRHLLHHRAIRRLLLFDFTASFCLQGPMGLFPVYVRARGGDMQTVGYMWIFMLAAEIPLILLSGASLARFGPRGLIAVGVLAGGVRWAVCGLTDDLSLIYPAQLLHGVVVAGLLIGGPLYLEAVVPESLRSTAQGLLAMAGVGLGGILSNVTAGWLLEHAGAHTPYLLGGMGAIALALFTRRILPAPVRYET